MSLKTPISSSISLLLKKSDADLDSAPKKSIGSVKFSSFSSSPSSVLSLLRNGRRSGAVRCGSTVDEQNAVLSSGLLFQPFEEVKKEDFIVPISPQTSLGRQRYFDDCEAAINEQINVEYNVSYVYHALYAYFDRDNVSHPAKTGFAEERACDLHRKSQQSMIVNQRESKWITNS